MSYAEIVFATVPDAPPTWKKRRATSWPAPISAKVPYFLASRLIWSAFSSVFIFSPFIKYPARRLIKKNRRVQCRGSGGIQLNGSQFRVHGSGLGAKRPNAEARRSGFVLKKRGLIYLDLP